MNDSQIADLIKVTKKYADDWHEGNHWSYVHPRGVKAGAAMYVEYFRTVESYINRGRRINSIIDFGCGVGIGEMTWRTHFSHLADKITFTNLCAGSMFGNTKYDRVLTELGVEYKKYYGKIDTQGNKIILPQDTQADCIIASKVSFSPQTNWEPLKPLAKSQGFLLTTYDIRNVNFDQVHVKLN